MEPSTLQDIIQNFNNSGKTNNLELEIRFKLSFSEWKKIYENVINNKYSGNIEQSINVITIVDKEVLRREVYFKNGIKQNEKYTNKKIEKSIFGKDYRIALSSETEIKPFTITSINEIRIKLRSSIIISENWRLDFTIVKSLNDANDVKKYKDIMFPIDVKLDPANYINFINKLNPNLYKYELEAEFIGKKVEINDIESEIELIHGKNFNKKIEQIDKKYHETLYTIAKLLLSDQDKINNISDKFKDKFTLAQLANKPIGLDLETYREFILPNINQYYLSDKADGDRCFIFLNDKFNILTNELYTFDMQYDGIKNAIIDAEIMGLNSNSFDKIYIFDILYFNDVKLTQENMETREKYIDKIMLYFEKNKKIEKKILVKLKNQKQIKDVYNRSTRLYPIDGLIFTPNFSSDIKYKYNQPENYFDMIIYKWKPPELMTIDFLVMKCPKNMIGIEPYNLKDGYTLYFLFCGIKKSVQKTLNIKKINNYKQIFESHKFTEKYFPIQFSPSIQPNAYIYYHPNDSKYTEQDINEHVVEFIYDFNTKCWKILKLRKDKDLDFNKGTLFGNDFITAESVFNEYQNPLTLEMLIDEKIGGSDNQYFMNKKPIIYKALTKFNGFVKAQLIRQLENSKSIVDLASGQGSDLFNYNGFNISEGLFIDIDKNALEELNKRKYEFNNDKFYSYNQKPKQNMNVITLNLNLKDNYLQNIEEIDKVYNKKANGVVINFAIHYLIINEQLLDNFINLVDYLLKPGGIFIFTCFDGEKINNLLKNIEPGNSWNLYENGLLKYSIKKLYTNYDIFNSIISVIHPFSNGTYYEENLINIKYIIDKFIEKKYVLQQNGSFGDWLTKYKEFNSVKYRELTKNDIIYLSLYNYCSLWKSF